MKPARPGGPLPETQALRRALLEHYDRNRRPLPWRGERDPYRILVSEVMLQQTRVETVRPYYERWLERFPDVHTLAGADPDEVLEAWEGLGYYRRARNLHRTARVVRDGGGELPGSYRALRELPGLGEYTAGAVASIAFGQAVPAVDGNARRVLARLFDEPRPTPAWLRARGAELLEPDRPGDWNQALMELGATLCTPRAPRCGDCPVEAWCAARAAGTEEERPGPRPSRPVAEATFALVVPEAGGRVMLERRPDQGLLASLWAFPERALGAGEDAREAALALAAERALEPAAEAVALPPVEHRFTHLAARYEPWLLPVSGAPSREGRSWVEPDRPTGLALPVAQRKVLEAAAAARSR